MESPFVLDTPDGFKIYGLLNTSSKKRNTKAILHVHGLGQSMHDYNAICLAHSFPSKGYDVIRVNLYHWEKQARRLIDCTISTHANDINLLIKFFKKKYKKLFCTGHSYGGPSLMSAKVNEFSAISLWDPSYIPQKIISAKDLKKEGAFYIDTAGTGSLLGQALMDEAEKFDQAHSIKLSKKCKKPIQVIYADKNSFWIKQGESFHTYAKGPTDERRIKLSKHCFWEEGAIAPLLRYTRQWFDQF